MSIAGIVLGKLKRVETTIYVLDLWPENLFSVLNFKRAPLRKALQHFAHWHYRRVDKIAALSQKMKARLTEATGIAEDKIVVMPQTCEKLYETNIHDEKLAKKFKGGFNILFAGNISPAQSFETVVAAAKNLHAAGLTDIRWIIVGDGMSAQWLKEEVKQAGLEKSFFFEGMKPMEDVPRYTDVADLLIGCLVKSELLEATIPAKVMSYIASGKPMVLAMDGEVQDLINKTIKSGLAGPAGDAQALTNNIQKIYKLSAVERQKMGKRGRDYHFKHFERNIVLSKLYKFIFS
jgi:glycosyltransferase involved in cell wall biosynthesis